LALRVAFVNSFRRVVSGGVHQALDFEEWRERGAVASIVDLSAERAEENHRSSWLGEGTSGGGGICQFSSLFIRAGQFTCCQRGLRLSLWGEGGHKKTTMGA